MDKKQIAMSPECVKIGKGTQREFKIRTPEPVSAGKKQCKKIRSQVKRFRLIENAHFPDHGIRKCIRVNSIFKSLSQDEERIKREIEENSVEVQYSVPQRTRFSQVGRQRAKINYFKVRKAIDGQPVMDSSRLINEYSLLLRGTHFNRKAHN